MAVQIRMICEVAPLRGTPWAGSSPPTRKAVAVAELTEAAAGRADLLAERAGTRSVLARAGRTLPDTGRSPNCTSTLARTRR
jgi:hypothetical protein